MRLNARGQAVAGVGAGQISIDNVPITNGKGGAPNWFTDDVVIYNGTKDGREWKILHYDIRTKKTQPVDDKGGNDVYAGNGVWARWLGDRGVTGLTASTGFSSPPAGLLEVGWDGVIYYCPDRQVGKGLIARTPSGSETIVLSPTQTTALNVRGTVGGAIYTGYNNRIGTWKLPKVVPVSGDIFNPRAVLVGFTWWVVYATHTRLLAQPFADPVGYVIADLGNTFGHDAVLFNGKIRVAYSTTQGEQPGQTKIVDVDLTKPRVPLESTPIPPKPEPPMPPIPNHLDVVKRARTKYAGLSGPERAGHIVNQVAWDLQAEGCGTFYKKSGDRYNDRSLDIVIYKRRAGDPEGHGQTFDILKDAEGKADPQWSRSEPTGFGDEHNWRAATNPGDVPEPEPEPPGNVKPRLEDIRNRMAACVTDLNEVINDL
jgi:hypothetical protein